MTSDNISRATRERIACNAYYTGRYQEDFRGWGGLSEAERAPWYRVADCALSALPTAPPAASEVATPPDSRLQNLVAAVGAYWAELHYDLDPRSGCDWCEADTEDECAPGCEKHALWTAWQAAKAVSAPPEPAIAVGDRVLLRGPVMLEKDGSYCSIPAATVRRLLREPSVIEHIDADPDGDAKVALPDDFWFVKTADLVLAPEPATPTTDASGRVEVRHYYTGELLYPTPDRIVVHQPGAKAPSGFVEVTEEEYQRVLGGRPPTPTEPAPAVEALLREVGQVLRSAGRPPRYAEELMGRLVAALRDAEAQRKAAFDDAETAEERARQWTAKVVEMQGRYKAAEADRDALRAQLTEATSALAKLHSEHAGAVAMNRAAEGAIATLETKLTEATARAERLEADLARERADLGSWRTEAQQHFGSLQKCHALFNGFDEPNADGSFDMSLPGRIHAALGRIVALKAQLTTERAAHEETRRKLEVAEHVADGYGRQSHEQERRAADAEALAASLEAVPVDIAAIREELGRIAHAARWPIDGHQDERIAEAVARHVVQRVRVGLTSTAATSFLMGKLAARGELAACSYHANVHASLSETVAHVLSVDATALGEARERLTAAVNGACSECGARFQDEPMHYCGTSAEATSGAFTSATVEMWAKKVGDVDSFYGTAFGVVAEAVKRLEDEVSRLRGGR